MCGISNGVEGIGMCKTGNKKLFWVVRWRYKHGLMHYFAWQEYAIKCMF
jgi:hypothetical protein